MSIALAFASLAGAGASVAVGSSDPGCAGVSTPSREGSTIAKVMVTTEVRRTPGGPAVWQARTSTPWGDNPTWLLVLGCRSDERGTRWLRVQLPVRPNGATGWLRADYALLGRTRYWVEVDTGRADVLVFESGKLVRVWRAVVGAAATPTPLGLFAIYDPVPQPRPDFFVGPWVIQLTAHSNVLDDYGGGPGRVAIHGRAGASLEVPLGSAASHGCIRVDNDVVSWLATTVPTGTPVFVRR